ncbi:hypothetical protein BDN71DRAFT_1430188 [Pleurotus eryngii]|uniref:DUF659 domain-containing protein n=1 Tax=Pleurotus eryngii TaxID=5323 RepID=A0A9P6DHG4_PLEER|nr:hypothetical protein BDN71DRAFT_1430188 [Pleurotus eryngii]
MVATPSPSSGIPIQIDDDDIDPEIIFVSMLFLIHGNVAFNVVENQYFQAFINKLWLLYEPAFQYVLSHSIMDAEFAQVMVDGMVEVAGKALSFMDLLNGKQFIATTTDNPTIMQAFHQKFWQKYPWILTFSCFLHGMNNIIDKIVAFPNMKKIIMKTTHIVMFFNGSHLWGVSYLLKLQRMECLRTPLITTTKFIINGIGNLKSCKATLADCMLELICYAHDMNHLVVPNTSDKTDGQDLKFWPHAKADVSMQ